MIARFAIARFAVARFAVARFFIARFSIARFPLLAAVGLSVQLACASEMSTAPNPAFDPRLRQSMEQTQLIGPGLPAIPAFQWTIETTRPLKKPKLMQESYQPLASALGLNGLAVSRVKDLRAKEPAQNRVSASRSSVDKPSYSLRGLERVKDDDTVLSFQALGLKLPPAPGSKFELNIDFEGQRIAKRCEVQAQRSAAEWHVNIPGQAAQIRCSGNARYAGMPVTLNSQVVYFERLGFFILASEEIRSAVANLDIRKRITDFRLL